jgi:hypothetical protein
MSMAAVPVAMMVNTAFLGTFVVLPPRLPDASLRSLAITTLAALTVWGLLSLLAGLCFRELLTFGLRPITIACGIVLTQVIFAAALCWRLLPAPKGAHAVKWYVVLMRGCAASTAIGVAVLLSQLEVPFVAGLASAFPAIFLTTMVSVWVSQGTSVPSGAAGPMALGSCSVNLYAMLCTQLYMQVPWLIGILIVWPVAVLFGSVPSFLYIRWRRSVNAAVLAASSASDSPVGPLSLLAAPYRHDDEEATGSDANVGDTIPKLGEPDIDGGP